ncbi:hypothetical protein LSAT2_029397 [Lamellibrachia satsuma]|nr:hypothetical protein LSAT2_029397 [Lamellibrachia satsuma]
MDKLINQCTDCSIACKIPTSNYCRRVCPGWSAISPSSTPLLSNSSTVLVVVMSLVCIAIISVLFAVFIVRHRRSQQLQHQQVVNAVEEEGRYLQGSQLVDAIEEESRHLDGPEHQDA